MFAKINGHTINVHELQCLTVGRDENKYFVVHGIMKGREQPLVLSCSYERESLARQELRFAQEIVDMKVSEIARNSAPKRRSLFEFEPTSFKG